MWWNFLFEVFGSLWSFGHVALNIQKTTLHVGNLYKYNKKRVLYFISTPYAEITRNASPCDAHFADGNGDIHMCEVPCPVVVSCFFWHINKVDMHTHLYQSCLRLEKKWTTFDGYFRLATTLLGINIVDTFHLACFHKLLPRGKLTGLNEEFVKD